MKMTLRILSYRNQGVPGAEPVRFFEQGGTLGRAPENALVLDDPGKYVSRVHARVLARDGVFYLEDLGSNPSIVNDRPLGKGVQVALAHGDRIAIGDYQLQAALDAAPPAPTLAPAPANDPSLPLFVPPEPPAPAPLPPLEAPPQRPALPYPDPVPIDALDALAGASILATGPGSAAVIGADPLGLNLFGAAPAPAPARAAESDHVSPELAALPVTPRPLPAAPAAPPAGALAIPDDYDPLADLLAPAPAVPVAPVAQVAPVAPPAADPPVIAPAADGPAAAPLPAGDGEVLQALLSGLGLPGLALDRPAAELAYTVGALLREATAGTMDVLMARALMKKESRIDMTMLSVRANNPLKFFPHAEGALTQMLTGAMAGYMAPLEAMAGAFDDLRAHELAVVAGMRAALKAVLLRFDPARIEGAFAQPAVLDRLLPASRKARMWDRLVALYDQVGREADDDMQRIFGETFSQAYEEQVGRLRQQRQ